MISGPDEHLILEDVQDDQGGYIAVSWNQFPTYPQTVSDSIEYFVIEQYNDGWVPIDSVNADESLSYTTTIATDAVLFVDELIDPVRYRVVAYSQG
ncbi:MAG: hypothetical protein IPM94_08120 [bacterium]|nr:hypothetical protein [bacterium]